MVRASPRQIPPMDRILRREDVKAALEEVGWTYGVEILRGVVEALRKEAREGGLSREAMADRVERLGAAIRRRGVEEAQPGLLPLINATGVILHTNLGRALLSEEAGRRVAEVSRDYVNLEYDRHSGGRGSREARLGRFLSVLFPGFSFHVVNNNAAAVLLALNTLADGKEVVVSRGELVEIGGSFRLPEILAKSGARLREVGTTNRTRIGDYARAVGPNTGALLRVHASNFRIIGFVESVPLPDLQKLARKRGIPLIVDEGSGNLHDLTECGIPDEPTVQGILADGADLVTFSGDKLLGGPQAGFLIGRADLVERIRKNPMSRALRVDKMTLAALEGTLLSHRRGTHGEDLPVQGMVRMALPELKRRVEMLGARIRKRCGTALEVEMKDGESVIGGGAAPVRNLPTLLLVLKPRDWTVNRLSTELRRGTPPIITRTGKDALLLDLRTVPPPREDWILKALGDLTEKMAGSRRVKRGTGK